MKKFILLFFLALLSKLYADEPSKYQIGISYSYHFLNSDISSFKVNQNNYTQVEIDQYNNDYDFNTILHNVGLNFNYSIIDEISAEFGGGLSFLKHETYNLKNGNRNLDFMFSSNDPGYFLQAAFILNYKAAEKLNLHLKPEIQYCQLKNLHGIESDVDQNTSQNVIHQSQLSWRAGLYAEYTFNLISTFIGVEYHDFRQNVDFDGYVKDVFDDLYFMERDIVYKQKMPFAVKGGIDITAFSGKHFIVEGTYGSGYSVSVKLINDL